MTEKKEDAARKRAQSIYRKLKKLYPDAKCGLDFANPFELYVATVLSAQCTDERVNKVTPALFQAYSDAASLAKAPVEAVEELVRSTGFFRNKAKSIQTGSQLIVQKFGGDVPTVMEDLLVVAGVGRKTANVILGNCFDTPGITVDTHVRRLSQRMELTTLNDPVKIERDLMALIPQKGWTIFSHTMISHGRQICASRKPMCEECGLRKICNYQHS
jgi:endonuclease III